MNVHINTNAVECVHKFSFLPDVFESRYNISESMHYGFVSMEMLYGVEMT